MLAILLVLFQLIVKEAVVRRNARRTLRPLALNSAYHDVNVPKGVVGRLATGFRYSFFPTSIMDYWRSSIALLIWASSPQASLTGSMSNLDIR